MVLSIAFFSMMLPRYSDGVCYVVTIRKKAVAASGQNLRFFFFLRVDRACRATFRGGRGGAVREKNELGVKVCLSVCLSVSCICFLLLLSICRNECELYSLSVACTICTWNTT